MGTVFLRQPTSAASRVLLHRRTGGERTGRDHEETLPSQSYAWTKANARAGGECSSGKEPCFLTNTTSTELQALPRKRLIRQSLDRSYLRGDIIRHADGISDAAGACRTETSVSGGEASRTPPPSHLHRVRALPIPALAAVGGARGCSSVLASTMIHSSRRRS